MQRKLLMKDKDILKFHTSELTNFEKYCRVIYLRNMISTNCMINPRIIDNYVTKKVFWNLSKSKSISHFKIIKNKFDLHQQNNCKNKY